MLFKNVPVFVKEWGAAGSRSRGERREERDGDGGDAGAGGSRKRGWAGAGRAGGGCLRSHTAPHPVCTPAPAFSAGEEHPRGRKRTGPRPGSSEGTTGAQPAPGGHAGSPWPGRSRRPFLPSPLWPLGLRRGGRPVFSSSVPGRGFSSRPMARRLAGPPHRRRARLCGPTFWPGEGEGTAATSEQKLPEAWRPCPAPSPESSTAAFLAVASDWLTSRPRGPTSILSVTRRRRAAFWVAL